MGFMDKLKEWESASALKQTAIHKAKYGKELNEKEKAYFDKHMKVSPEKFKEEFDNKEIQLAEKERIKKVKQEETAVPFGMTKIHKDKEGFFYASRSFSEEAPRMAFKSYKWNGPLYESKQITTTKTKGDNKTKGRGGQALAGGLLFGPVGAAVGASGKRKGKIDTTSTSTTETQSVEKPASARIAFRMIETGETKVFSDHINAGTNSLLENLFEDVREFPSEEPEKIASVANQIREYKQLLDDEIITQEEFDTKKKQLLEG